MGSSDVTLPVMANAGGYSEAALDLPREVAGARRTGFELATDGKALPLAVNLANSERISSVFRKGAGAVDIKEIALIFYDQCTGS